MTKNPIAGKLFMHQKQFHMEEIKIIQEPELLSKKETPQNLKPNDPRKISASKNAVDQSFE